MLEKKFNKNQIIYMDKIAILGPTNINFLSLHVDLNISEKPKIKRQQKHLIFTVKVFDEKLPHKELNSEQKNKYLSFLPTRVRTTFPARRDDWSLGALLMHAAGAGPDVYQKTCENIEDQRLQ
jgi:hypothetical protein